MKERCYCGDTQCPSCGAAQGTYVPRHRPFRVTKTRKQKKKILKTVEKKEK